MAGAGYKLFNTGDVLTAAQVNTYLQEQVVMVFANATARTAALSGVLSEGMVSYLQDTNAVEVYDGSSWTAISGGGSSTITTWVKTAAGSETSLSGNDDNGQSLSYTVGKELLFINGSLQYRGSDYVATTGNTITGLAALAANDVVTVWAVSTFSVAGAIPNSIVDAKADLITATAADTPARLAVGTDGQYLQADSTTATGLKWATASSGGLTLLSTTSLSGVSTTVNSISGSYKNLFVFVKGVYVNTDSAQINIRLNSDSGSNYANNIVRNTAGTLVGISSTESQIRVIARTPNSNTNALYLGNAQLFLPRYTDTDIQPYSLVSMGADAGAGTYQSYHGTGTYNNSAAITSVTVLSNDGTTTFTGGTIYIYGES